MSYHWERYVDDGWRPVAASALPEPLKTHKAVMFASRGLEMTHPDPHGNVERYRLVKRDSTLTPE